MVFWWFKFGQLHCLRLVDVINSKSKLTITMKLMPIVIEDWWCVMTSILTDTSPRSSEATTYKKKIFVLSFSFKLFVLSVFVLNFYLSTPFIRIVFYFYPFSMYFYSICVFLSYLCISLLSVFFSAFKYSFLSVFSSLSFLNNWNGMHWGGNEAVKVRWGFQATISFTQFKTKNII